MFYLAMRKSGVSENYAKLLYWGVRVGGPRWLLDNQVLIDGEIVTITIPQQPLTTLTNSDVQKMTHAFDYDPLLDGPGGLTEIEKRTPTTGPLPKNAIPK
jgi:hypothetical protein